MSRKAPSRIEDVDLEFECSATLDPGYGQARYCSECQKTVFDASKMTRRAYENLPKDACVMFTADEHGEILFGSERHPVIERITNVAVTGLLGLLLAGCQGESTEPKEPSPALESIVDRPIDLEQTSARVDTKISRAMLWEIHKEMYGEYPRDLDTPAPRASPTARAFRPGVGMGFVNDIEIIQAKRNIRQKRKQRKGKVVHMGIIRGDF